MSKEEIKSIIIHNAKHLGSVDVHMKNLLIDVNMLVEQLANIERQARISELKYWCAIDDIDSGLTYMDDGEACIRLTTLSNRIEELERGE